MSESPRFWPALPIAWGLTAFVGFGLAPTLSRADTLVDVTPTSMGDWSFDNRDSGGTVVTPTTGSIVSGPATPPLGTGSANLTLPSGSGDGASEIRDSGYSGVALTSITALSYSTYDTANNGQQFPYFGLVVSADGGASVFDTIFFEPPYQQPSTGNPSLPNQGATALNTWQTWNALTGAWWDNNNLSLPGNGPGHSLSFSDLLAAIAASAHVSESAITIVNTTDDSGHPLGGVRFDVGFASADDAFNGYIDNFTIGINDVNSTFNFDPASATPLPTTLPLFVSGLGLIGLLGWRKKCKAAQAA